MNAIAPQQSAAAPPRPQLVAARQQPAKTILDEVIANTATSGGFDPELWNIINRSDDALVSDEVMYGAKSGAFVYSFKIRGANEVSGISVVGARHLARKYGNLKHRIVATVEKRGALHIFTNYDPMSVTTTTLRELEEDTDYYKVVVEVTDNNTGNTIQVAKTELRTEKTRDGKEYNRPHFDVIAESKAYRNAILALVPQDIQRKFMDDCLRTGGSKDITDGALDAKRGGIISYCAGKGIAIDRKAVWGLSMDQITGLSEAARTSQAAFVNAAQNLGVVAPVNNGEQPSTDFDSATGEVQEPEPAQQRRADPPPAKAAAPKTAPAAKPAAPQPDYSAPGSLADDESDFPV
jgi:hypothetical protein